MPIVLPPANADCRVKWLARRRRIRQISVELDQEKLAFEADPGFEPTSAGSEAGRRNPSLFDGLELLSFVGAARPTRERA